MEAKSVIFTANLFLLSPEFGGRSTPIQSGFRTDIKFNDETRYCSLRLLDIDVLSPGATASVEVKTLLHSDSEINQILQLKICPIYEGAIKIGELNIQGKVIEKEIRDE